MGSQKSEIEGLHMIIQKRKRYQAKLSLNLPKIVRSAGNKLKKEMKKNASLTDHTLNDLAKMGHPYSTRHKGGTIHDPFWLVHKQKGGKLRKAIKIRSSKRSSGGYVYQATAIVGIINPSDCPYAKHVIMGTTCLQSRDFVRSTLRVWKKALYKKMRKDLQTVMRGGNISGK